MERIGMDIHTAHTQQRIRAARVVSGLAFLSVFLRQPTLDRMLGDSFPLSSHFLDYSLFVHKLSTSFLSFLPPRFVVPSRPPVHVLSLAPSIMIYWSSILILTGQRQCCGQWGNWSRMRGDNEVSTCVARQLEFD